MPVAVWVSDNFLGPVLFAEELKDNERRLMKKIVYVNVLGGPPFDYVIERLSAFGEVHVVQPEEMSNTEEAQLRAAVDHIHFPQDKGEHAATLAEFLVDIVREIKADAIVTFDEFCLRETSAAAQMLGLPGPGPNAFRSVNKHEIYKALEPFGLLGRPYAASRDLVALVNAPIPAPFVIKPSECAGSLGVFAVTHELRPQVLLDWIIRSKMATDEAVKTIWTSQSLAEQEYIKEGLLIGNAKEWFGREERFADYISVEGVILDRKYHPLAITQNYPLLDPFIETVSITPSTLPLSRQKTIVALITPFIESIGLENCGVHTEIKLLPDGAIAVIETAARFAGWSILPQMQSVFGIDAIGILTMRLLAGRSHIIPTFEQIYERRHGCSATINLLPVSDAGEAWDSLAFTREPDFTTVVNPRTKWTFTPYCAPGQTLDAFEPMTGAWNSFGKVYIESDNFDTLHSDIASIRANVQRLIN